jgi:transcriptional regulator GlxA family with amidase domain
MVAFPGCQILDVTGPLEVFSRTSRWLEERGQRKVDAYRVEIVGIERGPFRVSSGLTLHADRGFAEVRDGIDTLLVAGGMSAEEWSRHRPLLRWLKRQSTRVRRLASVCTGAFLLAEAGLLEGRRATTHWASCADLAKRYPHVKVEADTIYVQEGSISTSAGVTAGMDLALAMVEEDFGRDVALAVARLLVLFLRRPGGQAQFSAQLQAQLAQQPPLRALQAWIGEHPEADLGIETLARRVNMSPRHFARVFTREVGTPPARYAAMVRVETARRMLEETTLAQQAIATRCGFAGPEVLRRSFLRLVGVSPGQYRERFTRSRPAAAARLPRARRRTS